MFPNANNNYPIRSEGYFVSRPGSATKCKARKTEIPKQKIKHPRVTSRGHFAIIFIIIVNPLRVVGAPQMILQLVFSIFPCSPLPSGKCRTPGLYIPLCCLPTSSSVCLVHHFLSKPIPPAKVYSTREGDPTASPTADSYNYSYYPDVVLHNWRPLPKRFTVQKRD